MAYTDKDYFLTMIKSTELNALIKDSTGEPQEEYLTEKIKAADDMIDSYLRTKVKALPIDPVPDMVKMCSYYMATYFLHDRIQNVDVPERVKNNYDVAINWLKDVASGRVSLDITAADSEGGVSYFTEPTIFS